MKLLLVCLILAALALAACTPAGSPEEDGAATDSAPAGDDETAEPAAAAAQELTVGVGADPWIDAENDRKRRPTYPLNADVCETLIALDSDYALQPVIASDWEFVGDDTFRFTIADGPTFADGTPVDAEAVKYSIDYTTQEPETGFSFIGPDSTKVIDDRTVEITTTEPNLRLIEQINHPTYAILSPGDDPLNDPMVTCTGPFQVVEYVAEERLVVERNDNYWGEPARLDQITFRFFADDTTRALALQNGEVDMITDVPRGILSSLAELPGITIDQAPVGQVMMIYVARRDAEGNDRVLADPLLRRAAAMAMDRESFVAGVLDGNGEVVPTVAPPSVFGEFADTIEGLPYDPEAAAELLDEAGWALGDDGIRSKEGEPLEMTIIYARVDLTVAEFVQAQLQELGIQATIDQLDAGAYRERLENGNYDLDISLPSQNDANPSFLPTLRWYSKSNVPNAQFTSPGPDTEFERLIEETQSATDDVELRRLAAEAMRVLMEEEVGGIPLAGTYPIFALRDEVQGFQPHPSGTNQRWSTVFISE